jgi:hypothetical protein
MKTLLKYTQKQFVPKLALRTFATAAAPKTVKQENAISKRFHEIYLQEMEKLKLNTYIET